MLSILAVVVLLAVTAVALRVLLKPPVFRELRGRPLLATVALAGGLAIGWWLLAHLPTTDSGFPALAAVSAGVTFLAHRRARPNAGRRRGLPPGTLGLRASLDAITDIGFYAKAARHWGPVFKMAQFHRPVVCIVNLATGLQVMERGRANLIQPRLPFGRLSPGNYIEFMNDEQHTRYRGILRTALSGRVVTDARPGVGAVVQHELGTMLNHHGAGVDPEPGLQRIAFTSLVRVMFGIPVDDPRVDQLRSSFDDLGSHGIFVERRPEEREKPYSELIAIVRELGRDILTTSGSPGPSPHSVLGEVLRANPEHLNDDTLIGNLVLMVHVTRSNVRGLLGWALKEFCDHPEWVARISTSPDATRSNSVDALATNFVNETLRLHQSEYFYREVAHPITIGDYRIPKGWLIRVCVRECHDRPDVFPHPEHFDPSRFADSHFDRTEYCPFSDGTHSCFGAGLAVMIAKTFVVALMTDFEARTAADGPVERQGNRHWSHWRPSRSFRVALTRRVGSGSAGRENPGALTA